MNNQMSIQRIGILVAAVVAVIVLLVLISLLHSQQVFASIGWHEMASVSWNG